MYFEFEDTDDERTESPMRSESDNESEDAKKSDDTKDGSKKELYSLDYLPSVYDALAPSISKTQTVFIVGCSCKHAPAPDKYTESWTKLKRDPEFYKTFSAKGDLELVNQYNPSHVMHVKKAEIPAIFQKVKSCKGDSTALCAAMQNMADAGTIWRTKRQTSLSDADREQSSVFYCNTYSKTAAVVDELFTASTQTDVKSYAVLLDDTVESLDTAINIFDMAVLKKDKFGMRAIYLSDVLKILFNSGVTKAVIVNFSGIVDDNGKDNMTPVFTEEPVDEDESVATASTADDNLSQPSDDEEEKGSKKDSDSEDETPIGLAVLNLDSDDAKSDKSDDDEPKSPKPDDDGEPKSPKPDDDGEPKSPKPAAADNDAPKSPKSEKRDDPAETPKPAAEEGTKDVKTANPKSPKASDAARIKPTAPKTRKRIRIKGTGKTTARASVYS